MVYQRQHAGLRKHCLPANTFCNGKLHPRTQPSSLDWFVVALNTGTEEALKVCTTTVCPSSSTLAGSPVSSLSSWIWSPSTSALHALLRCRVKDVLYSSNCTVWLGWRGRQQLA